MGKFSRDKGNRIERWLVNQLQRYGFAAERVPLSGAAHGRFGGDISVPVLGLDRRVEVKAKAHGFNQLYEWLSEHDLLIVKADHREPLVVVPWRLAIEIAEAAEKGRSPRPDREIEPAYNPERPIDYVRDWMQRGLSLTQAYGKLQAKSPVDSDGN